MNDDMAGMPAIVERSGCDITIVSDRPLASIEAEWNVGVGLDVMFVTASAVKDSTRISLPSRLSGDPDGVE